MARRFVRVDLSRNARDFRPIAVEPGLPLLDRISANARLLNRWLGRLAADPEWDDESVEFYVRDDHGGRLEDVVCQPATRSDLEGLLADELQELRHRLDRVRPDTPTERTIHSILHRTLRELVDDPCRTDVDCHLFRYQDVQDRWRLVWCWGFQRADLEEAPALLCPDNNCKSLYVRRPGTGGRCPRCAAGLTPREPRDWKKPILLGLLLLLLLAAGGYWALTWRRLIATPSTWTGPLGSRIEFKVLEKGLFQQRDLTGYVAAVTADPRIVRLDRYGPAAVAAAPGETSVLFLWGNLSSTVRLKVQPAKAPKKISVEPAAVELGVGTTARLRLIAEYDDGSKADLTNVALWTAQNDGTAFLWNGLVEGVAEGATSVTARYRPSPDSPYQDASATVTVRKLQFQSLEASVALSPIGVGRATNLRIDAVTADGKRYSVLDSSLLTVRVEPVQVAQLSGRQVRGNSEGQATLKATFDDRLNVAREFAVANMCAVEDLFVLPQELLMAVHEIVDLSIASPTAEPIQITSSDPRVVEVTDANRLVGRSAGNAQVEVVQGDQKATVSVKVEAADFRSALIDPTRVGVPVDDLAAVRLLAVNDSGRWAEIAPDRLSVEKVLSPRYAEFDPRAMTVRGVQPTDPKSPQTLGLAFDKLHASAPVDVVLPPLRLDITPVGSIDVPLGQRVKLQGWATYHGTRRVELPPDSIQWQTTPATDPAGGITVSGGYANALKPNSGPLTVWGTYFGRESNRLAVKSVAAAPVNLHLQPDPASLGTGEAGTATLTGTSGESAVDLVPELAQFSSSSTGVLTVDRLRGAYRAIAPGDSTVTAKHSAAQEPATAKVTVTPPTPKKRDIPIAVRILSDQGSAVQFAVGTEFDDFRVEAEYADGVTRLATKKATLRTTQSADEAPLTAARGRLLGVRPGQTTVQAEFDGVHSQKGLGVTVTGQVDIDQIVLRPSPATILPGETITLQAIGQKGAKSVGSLAGFGKMVWKSADEQIAHVSGPAVTGLKLGQTTVTAQFGSVTSQPAVVEVVDSVADRLTIDPRRMEMVAGESRQIGSDVVVSRGNLDVSRLCSVGCSPSSVVEYRRDTNSLVAVAPGVAVLAVACGDKIAHATVEVSPASRTIRGEVVVEPAAATLVPGQAIALRVYVIDSQGTRYDRTASALLRSSDSDRVKILGSHALAITPGAAHIQAAVPGCDKTGKAFLNVANEQLIDVFVEPSSLVMSVGERADLRILGRSAGGTYPLFAQPGLITSVGGPNPAAVRLSGTSQVEAVAPGQAEVAVTWRGQPVGKVPVVVAADRLTDLAITPSVQNIEVGDRVVYSVTGMRGGRPRLLGPDDGLQLFVSRPDVGQVVDATSVRGINPGRTLVTAQVGAQQAEASLIVAPEGSLVVLRDRRGRIIHRIRGHERVVLPDDVVTYSGSTYVDGAPPAGVVGLQFVPDVLRLPLGSAGAAPRIVELLADGRFGRDVTNDPGLEIASPERVARLERAAGSPIFRPLAPGETSARAKLGSLATVSPLLIQVGDVAIGAARLRISPDVITLAPGQTTALRRVSVDPGTGQSPFDVDYRLAVRGGQGIVAVEGGKRLRGLASGVAAVEVTAVDPGRPYDGVSTIAQVDVGAAERVWIEPGDCTLQLGQRSPRFAVLAAGEGSPAHEVPVPLETCDPSVLAPDPASPGRFIARDFGATQLRALYRGCEGVVNVNVSGKRFLSVTTTLNEADRDFDVTIEVLAAASEGPIDYRVYADGQTPPATWQASQPAGAESRRVVLRSPRMPYVSRSSVYRLILEAQDPAGKVQRYPFTFRLVPKLERTDKKAETRKPKVEQAEAMATGPQLRHSFRSSPLPFDGRGGGGEGGVRQTRESVVSEAIHPQPLSHRRVVPRHVEEGSPTAPHPNQPLTRASSAFRFQLSAFSSDLLIKLFPCASHGFS
jgi:hypothetical protein